MTTTTPQDLANVLHPAGATNVYPWDDRGGVDPLQRYFAGSSWVVARDGKRDYTILIDGTQYPDGRVERVVSLNDDELPIDRARALARSLIAAADEAERMNGYDAAVTRDDPADDAWSDPAWQVDSATRTCCGGIGGHTRECLNG